MIEYVLTHCLFEFQIYKYHNILLPGSPLLFFQHFQFQSSPFLSIIFWINPTIIKTTAALLIFSELSQGLYLPTFWTLFCIFHNSPNIKDTFPFKSFFPRLYHNHNNHSKIKTTYYKQNTNKTKQQNNNNKILTTYYK